MQALMTVYVIFHVRSVNMIDDRDSILMSYSMVTKPNHDVGCLTSTHHPQTKTTLLDSKTKNKRKKQKHIS